MTPLRLKSVLDDINKGSVGVWGIKVTLIDGTTLKGPWRFIGNNHTKSYPTIIINNVYVDTHFIVTLEQVPL